MIWSIATSQERHNAIGTISSMGAVGHYLSNMAL